MLRVLVVEDSEQDFDLLKRELRKGAYDLVSERVETRAAMEAALAARSWDVILSDWSLPHFSALAALALLKEKGIDLPFIIVSGTIGEDTAVEALKSGAHDFLLKDKLARLQPAVERELREAKVRRERDEMREQLLISNRMASVGILAAGVAHEINNPLSCIIANLDVTARHLGELSKRVEGMNELLDPVRDACESAERVRRIVRDLKIFSRAEEDTRGPVDVERVIESSLRMARTEIRYRARVVKEYEAVPSVLANESRLGQVFLNLIVNAAQAISEGRAEQNEIRIRLRAEARARVVTEIADTGPGMSRETLQKLFTPFFTTKPAGVGTGLGLTICKRIISDLGGEIAAESELGKGTVLRVVLPAGQPSADRALPVAAAAVASTRRGRVLTVDDEPMITAIVCRALSPQHDVTPVASASDALQRIGRGERYDVILSDLMMPQMTGMELFAELVRIAPEQAERAVFLTGGAFTPGARAFLDQVPNRCLEKPFTAQQLRATINECVSGAGTPRGPSRPRPPSAAMMARLKAPSSDR